MSWQCIIDSGPTHIHAYTEINTLNLYYRMEEERNSDLHCIGSGSCGSVWAPLESGMAFKREDGGPSRSLKNDFDMHQRVLDSMSCLNKIKAMHGTDKHPGQLDNPPQITVPECYHLIRPSDQDWWTENLRRFPTNFEACNTLQSQRVPPFSEATRELLIDKYCPPEIKAEVSRSIKNRVCIIRVYLGRRRVRQEPGRRSKVNGFSLRNYPLHVDQMGDMGVSSHDMSLYARTMAEALATLHWIGKMDGNDLEFVLAPPDGEQQFSNTISNVLGEHAMWVIDFDLCRDMPKDEDDVKQAVKAYWRNDPYYPRPRSKLLWEQFRKQYLQTSDAICGALGLDTIIGLPKLFIDLIEKEGT